MTQKEARKIMLWKAIERYRTAGGREEHHAYKEALDNYIDGMLDVSEMDEVAHRFAHPLALELECVLADRNANWDRAMNLIGEYRSAMNAIHEQHSPTHMGEPLRHNSIADVHEAARLLEAARALPVDGLDAWQPIETAPKDGTKLLGLVHFPGDDICKPFSEYSLIQWDKGFKSSICDRKPQWDKQFRGEVTHWQPLPRPPIAKQQEPS